MTVVADRFADEATDRWLVYDTPCVSVRLTEPLLLFLRGAVTDGLRPVLVTSAEARLSPFVAATLAEAGGSWVVRSPDGPFDAVTGQALASFDDLARPPTGLHPRFLALPTPSRVVVTYDVYTTAPADSQTRVGLTAQALTAALGGTLDLWGTVEPLLDPWDADQITAFAQQGMPRAPVVLASGRDGEHARIWVARSRHGLYERSHGGVLTPTPERLVDLAPAAAQALIAAMNHRHNVSLALAWASARSEAAASAPGRRPVDQPLAVLLGPRALHDLSLDLDDLATRHDIQVLGRARVPSLLVRFPAPDIELWTQLEGLLEELMPRMAARGAAPSERGRSDQPG